jgi:integrase
MDISYDLVTLDATHGAPLLAVDELAPAAQAALRALLDQGESPNTVRSYRSAARYWAAWFSLRYGRALELPLPVTVVLQFIVDHGQRQDDAGRLVHELPAAVDAALVAAGHKAAPGAPTLATLTHRVSVLSKLHQLQGLANPCDDGRVRELMARLRRSYARRGAQQVNAKPALTREPLEALLATCDASLAGLRDRALLLFAFASGGRRRSEVTAATLDNTRRVRLDGTAGWVYQMGVSKSNQTGRTRADSHKPVVGRAADALDAWLAAWAAWAAAAGQPAPAGALWRRVRKGGHVAEPLTPQAVRAIVQRRAALAGLDASGFSAHSLRSGFVTEAAAQNIPMPETMALTGHRSPASVIGYFRKGEVLSMRAARLTDLDEKKEQKDKKTGTSSDDD